MRGFTLAVVLLALSGCARPAPSATPEARAQALSDADKAAGTLGKTLKARLQSQLPEGVGQAMNVCADEAQAIGAKVASEQGASVGRASLRTRNPKNAAPEWVRLWLEAQGERPAEGVEGLSRIDETPQGPVARVVKPIAVEAACVLCHGAPESLAPEVTAVLAERYPQDRATGYEVGDLRGALWAEVPVTR